MDTNSILKDANNISLVKEDSKGFCEIWPNAKKGLELMKDIVKNPALKVVISTIISVGDAVSSRICG